MVHRRLILSLAFWSLTGWISTTTGAESASEPPETPITPVFQDLDRVTASIVAKMGRHAIRRAGATPLDRHDDDRYGPSGSSG